MEMILAAFIAELRVIGLPVSLSENVDAAAALRAIPLADRDQVKSALAATLVKNHDHYRAFELAFDIFFGGRRLDRLAEGNGSGEASQAGFGTFRSVNIKISKQWPWRWYLRPPGAVGSGAVSVGAC